MKSNIAISMEAAATNYGLVLLYHSVGPANPGNPPDSVHHVDTETLDGHLRDIGRYFTFVSLDEYARSDHKNGLCAVTFDDGYRNILETAAPVLDSHGIRGTLFMNAVTLAGGWNWRDKVRAIIVNGKVDAFYQAWGENQGNQRFYRHSKTPEVNSEELDRRMDDFLSAYGIDVHSVYGDYPYLTERDLHTDLPLDLGNHSARHYLLSSLGADQQQQEIVRGHSALAAFDLDISSCFSVPFGGTDDINEHTLPLVREAGYESVLMSRQRLQSGLVISSGLQVLERFMPRSVDICSEILSTVG